MDGHHGFRDLRLCGGHQSLGRDADARCPEVRRDAVIARRQVLLRGAVLVEQSGDFLGEGRLHFGQALGGLYLLPQGLVALMDRGALFGEQFHAREREIVELVLEGLAFVRRFLGLAGGLYRVPQGLVAAINGGAFLGEQFHAREREIVELVLQTLALVGDGLLPGLEFTHGIGGGRGGLGHGLDSALQRFGDGGQGVSLVHGRRVLR